MSGDLILLTGATGFVGFATLRAALRHGYRVRAAVRSEKKLEAVRSNPTLKDVSEDQLSFVVVPDFLADGAFDDAVKDVKYILHIASPIPRPEITGDDDLDAEFIQPAIQATLGVFRSARKSGNNVQRIVVTSSAAALVPMSVMAGQNSDEIFGPDSRGEALPSPYMNDTQAAYAASKILALKHAEEFIASEKPSFDAVHIHPTIVLGRDELALTSKDVDSGSNHYGLAPVLGVHNPDAFPVSIIHIEDVALAHIRALDSKVAGNQSFMLSNVGDEGYSWDDPKSITEKHFPQAIEKGLVPNNGSSPSLTILGDVSKTEEQLGIKPKTFENMIVDLVGHYIELLEKEKSQ